MTYSTKKSKPSPPPISSKSDKHNLPAPPTNEHGKKEAKLQGASQTASVVDSTKVPKVTALPGSLTKESSQVQVSLADSSGSKKEVEKQEKTSNTVFTVKTAKKYESSTSKAVSQDKESDESGENGCCTNITSHFVQKTTVPSPPPSNEDKKVPPPKPPKPTKEDIDKAHNRLSGAEKQILGSNEGGVSASREVSVAKQVPEPTVIDSSQPHTVEISSGTGIQDDVIPSASQTKAVLSESSSDTVKEKPKATDNEPMFSGFFKFGLFNKKKKSTEQKSDITEIKNEEIKEGSVTSEEKSETDKKNKQLDEGNNFVKEEKRLTEEKSKLTDEKNISADEKSKLTDEKNISADEKSKLSQEKSRLSEVQNKLAEEKNKLIEERNRLAEQKKIFAEIQEKLTEEKRKIAERKKLAAEQKSQLPDEKAKLIEMQKKLTEDKKKLMEEQSKLLEQKAHLTEMKTKLTEEMKNSGGEKSKVREEKSKVLEEKSKVLEEKSKLSDVRSKLAEEKNKLIEEKNRLTEQKKIFAELQERLTEEKRRLAEEIRKSAEEKSKLPEDKEKLFEEKRKLTEEKNKLTEERNKLLEEKNKLTEKKIKITEEIKKSCGERDKLPDEKNKLSDEKNKLTEEKNKLSDEKKKLSDERNKLTEEKNKLTNESSKLSSGLSHVDNSTVNDNKQSEPILPSTDSGQTNTGVISEKALVVREAPSEKKIQDLKSVGETNIRKCPPVRPPPPSRRFDRSDDNLSIKSEIIRPDRPPPPTPPVSLKKPKGSQRKSRSRSKTVEVTPESLPSTSKHPSFVQRFKSFLDFGKKKPGKTSTSSEPDLSKTEGSTDEFDALFSSSPKDGTTNVDTSKEVPVSECSSAQNNIILTSQAAPDNVITDNLGAAANETAKIILTEPAKEIAPGKTSAFAKVNEITSLPPLLSVKPDDVIVQKEDCDKADNSQTAQECSQGSLHCDNVSSQCTSSTKCSKLATSSDMSCNTLSGCEGGTAERSKQVSEETVKPKTRKEVRSTFFVAQATETPAQTLPATTPSNESSKNKAADEQKIIRDGIQQELNSIFVKKMDLKSLKLNDPNNGVEIQTLSSSETAPASVSSKNNASDEQKKTRDGIQQELNSIFVKKMDLQPSKSSDPSNEVENRTLSSSETAPASRDGVKKELNAIFQKKMSLKSPESDVSSSEAEIRTHDNSSSGTISARSSDASCQESSDECEDFHDGPEKTLTPEEKRLNKLRCIAREIMSSESTFVDVLRLLNDDFRSAVRECSEEKGFPIVPEDVMNTIFRYLPQLQNLNENLLAEIKQRTDNWGPSQKISDVIVKIGPFLKLYSSYIREFGSVSLALDEACRKHTHFGQLVKDFEARSICQKLALKHFLLKPVQRIPQYRLLLDDYLRNLTPDSEDYNDTVKALQIVSEVANHANEYMKQGDNCLKLVSIQNSLLTHHEIVKPGKVFIREGELMKLSRRVMQSRWFILFNDSLLYLTPAQQGLFRINHELPLTGMQVSVSKQTEYRNEFSVISVTRSFTLAAKSLEERDGWIRDLNRAIKENDEKRCSFISKLEKDTSSYSLPDVSLGKQAPVWIPDTRVTMCQLCMTDFTITFRRHHCRACGRVVCSNCSFHKAVLQYLDNQSARVCDVCNDKLNEGGDRISRTLSTASSGQGTPDPEVEGAKYPYGGTVPRNSKKAVKKLSMPNVLIEKSEEEEAISSTTYTPVRANDQGSDISGHLFMLNRKAWKRYWFVLKDKVLYTYKASEDVAAIKSLPLLGYTVGTTTTAQLGVDANHIFILKHPGQSDIIFHTESVGVTERWVEAVKSATVL